jgi:hypothetical protein
MNEVSHLPSEQVVVLRSESQPSVEAMASFTLRLSATQGRLANAVCTLQRPGSDANPWQKNLDIAIQSGQVGIKVPSLDVGDTLVLFAAVVVRKPSSPSISQLLRSEVQPCW